MGFSLNSITQKIIFLSLATTLVQSQETIKSARILDLVIRDYTFESYKTNFKTGKLHSINLPANLSGIKVDTVRFRCGSLHRYGAKIKEFQLSIGLKILPCAKRVMIVRQNLGSNWSSLYYDNYELSGYQLVSPVLGLLAYNLGETNNASVSTNSTSSSSSSSSIRSDEKRPIIIDFSTTKSVGATSSSPSKIPLCARFGDGDGKVTLSNQVGPGLCATTGDGHFGLVVEYSPVMPPLRGEDRKEVSRWRIVIGGAMGAAVGAVLIGLLMVAVFVKTKKKKERREELVRRAYEEEALQVSMVGHVRALTASCTRTLPTIEHFEYRPPPS
ncbi:hypothetical protein ABFS83_01G079900 [Erythranthe nasuta]